MCFLPQIVSGFFLFLALFVHSEALADPSLKVHRKVSRTGAQQIHYSISNQVVAQFEVSALGQITSVTFPRLSQTQRLPNEVSEKLLNVHELYAWREIKELQQVSANPEQVLESRLGLLPKYFFEVKNSIVDQAQFLSLLHALVPNSIPVFFHEVFHLRLAQGKRQGQKMVSTLEELAWSDLDRYKALFLDQRQYVQLSPHLQAQIRGSAIEKAYFQNGPIRTREDILNELVSYQEQANWEKRIIGSPLESTTRAIEFFLQALVE